MKALIKKILNLTFENYEIFKIYSFKMDDPLIVIEESEFQFVELTEQDLLSNDSILLNKNKSYFGKESTCFGCLYKNQIVGLCFYWYGTKYLTRNFISLGSTDAKLVQIEIEDSMKGKGIAPKLITFSSSQMFERNFKTLYARIWHSNIPSIKCFTKANWQFQYTIIAGKFKFGPTFKLSFSKLKF